MNEIKIKKNIKEIIEYTCNVEVLSLRGVNENTIYKKLKDEKKLNEFIDVIETPKADCMIFDLLDEM